MIDPEYAGAGLEKGGGDGSSQPAVGPGDKHDTLLEFPHGSMLPGTAYLR